MKKKIVYSIILIILIFTISCNIYANSTMPDPTGANNGNLAEGISDAMQAEGNMIQNTAEGISNTMSDAGNMINEGTNNVKNTIVDAGRTVSNKTGNITNAVSNEISGTNANGEATLFGISSDIWIWIVIIVVAIIIMILIIRYMNEKDNNHINEDE